MQQHQQHQQHRQQQQQQRRRRFVSWMSTDDENHTLRTVDLEEAILRGAPTPQRQWSIIASQKLCCRPERYFLHLARVTMMLIEKELNSRAHPAADSACLPEPDDNLHRLLQQWDALVLTGEGRLLQGHQRTMAWMVRSRLFLLVDYENWIADKRLAQQLLPKGSDMLVHLRAPPVMQYDLATCVEAMDLLVSAWRETALTCDLQIYVRLLKARATAFAAYAFTDTQRMNRADLMAKNGHHVNVEFFAKCDHAFTPLEREINVLQNVLIAHAAAILRQTARDETSSLATVQQWARTILQTPRVHAITQRFRDALLQHLLYPGEKELFAERWPHADPNPRNIVARLRSEDLDRYGLGFLQPAVLEVLARPAENDDHVPGYCIVRNLVLAHTMAFLLEEQGVSPQHMIVWADDVVANTTKMMTTTTTPTILQIAGSFFLWLPRPDARLLLQQRSDARLLIHCGRRFSTAFLEWLQHSHIQFVPAVDHHLPVAAAADDQGSNVALQSSLQIEEELDQTI